MRPSEYSGSPPHTWRILTYDWVDPGSDGITSTYVENTGDEYKHPSDAKDHLHIRGEYNNH